MPDYDDSPEQEFEGPSKSARKRQMTALQDLGESLTTLSEKQLAKVPIEDPRLLEAIREARRIRSNSARKRQLQYVGKLMRSVDPEPIQAALDAMRQVHHRQTESFHELEQLREAVLVAGPAGADLVLRRWPRADRQQLRQLILQHQRELKADKPPTASRKLFRYLRQLLESDPGHS